MSGEPPRRPPNGPPNTSGEWLEEPDPDPTGEQPVVGGVAPVDADRSVVPVAASVDLARSAVGPDRHPTASNRQFLPWILGVVGLAVRWSPVLLRRTARRAPAAFVPSIPMSGQSSGPSPMPSTRSFNDAEVTSAMRNAGAVGECSSSPCSSWSW